MYRFSVICGRKAIACLLVLMMAVLMPVSAMAEALPAEQVESAYVRYGDTGTIVRKLQKYLEVTEKRGDTACFGELTQSALLAFQDANNLEPTGEFDAETLVALLDVSPDDPAINQFYWVPMNGGKRYHTKADCSEMIEPRQMPLPCAEILGFTPCQRCCSGQ